MASIITRTDFYEPSTNNERRDALKSRSKGESSVKPCPEFSDKCSPKPPRIARRKQSDSHAREKVRGEAVDVTEDDRKHLTDVSRRYIEQRKWASWSIEAAGNAYDRIVDRHRIGNLQISDVDDVRFRKIAFNRRRYLQRKRKKRLAELGKQEILDACVGRETNPALAAESNELFQILMGKLSGLTDVDRGLVLDAAGLQMSLQKLAALRRDDETEANRLRKRLSRALPKLRKLILAEPQLNRFVRSIGLGIDRA